MFARAGHEVLVSGSRDPAELQPLAEEIGGHVGTPTGAVEFGEVVLFAVPWRAVDDVLASLGSLEGKIVIDTTNQFGAGGWQTWGAARQRRSTRSGCRVRATRSPSTP